MTLPTVQVLSDSDIQVTVGKLISDLLIFHSNFFNTACRTIENAKKLCKDIKNAHPISLDVTNSAALDTEVEKVDIVVSLIPYEFHATVIKAAIRAKKNVVTTSYVSPAMLELENDAKKAGITVMNEIGLDPGKISEGLDSYWWLLSYHPDQASTISTQ